MKGLKYLLISVSTIFLFSCSGEPEKSKSIELAEIPISTAPVFIESSFAIEADTIVPVKKIQVEVVQQKIKEPEWVAELEVIDAFHPVSNLFQQFEKEPELISFSAQIDTVFFGKEGTEIRVEKNTFVYAESGEDVVGSVMFELREYYSLSDILLANLTTKSSSEIIETGGMINIEATSSGKICVLKENATIEIGFPFQEEKENMQLFNGTWDGNNVDWEVADVIVNPSLGSNISNVLIIEQMPMFPKGEEALYEFITRNTVFPQAVIDKDVKGTVQLSFVVEIDGQLSDVQIMKGLNEECNQEAIRVIGLMPNWIPGRVNNQKIPVQYNLQIQFYLAGDLPKRKRKFRLAKIFFKDPIRPNNNDNNFARNFEKEAENGNMDNENISRYLLSTSKLGWINCDRFIDNDQPKVDYLVRLKDSYQSDVKIVFHKFKSVLQGGLDKNGHHFSGMPLNEKVTVIAIKYKNDKPFLAIDETTINEVGEIKLAFEPVTIDLLKSEMEKLNKIHLN